MEPLLLEPLVEPGSLTIRSDEGDWLQLFEGVFKKTLLIDEQEHMESYLLRIGNPGTDS